MVWRAVLAASLALPMTASIGVAGGQSGDYEAGKLIFNHVCHRCHAALPYTGRIGVENLPKFLANPKGYKPTTAMTFPGLRSQKDIDDVITFITAPR